MENLKSIVDKKLEKKGWNEGKWRFTHLLLLPSRILKMINLNEISKVDIDMLLGEKDTEEAMKDPRLAYTYIRRSNTVTPEKMREKQVYDNRFSQEERELAIINAEKGKYMF